MKKLTLLFAAAAVLFAGCVRVTNIFEQVDGRLDKLESQKIPDIEEQIDAINASLENLSTMDKELKGYIDDLTATAEGLKEQIKATNAKLDEVKSALQGEISSAKEAVLEQLESVKSELVGELSKIDSAIALLQSKDSELEHKIADLRSYVNEELSKTTDWVGATFATLDQYNSLVDEVASVKSQIASVNDSIALLESNLNNKIKNDIAAAVSSMDATIQQKVKELTDAYIDAVATAKSEITAAYTKAIDSAIKNLDNSLRAWVGEQLAGYYTIAEVDAKIAALLAQLSSDDLALVEELNNLKESLKSTAEDITEAYKKAIEEAIASNGGVIDSSSLEPINNRIDNEVATINGKLAELQAQVDKNTADIAKLLARIQSVSYVPRYSDGKATVKFESDASEVVFDFEVSPKDAVAELATVWQSAVSVKAVYTQTRAVSFVEMPVLKFEADAENGVISVFASGENLSQDFKDGKLEASARLAISDGNNTLTSDYVPMVAKVMPPYVLETTFDSQKINGKIFIRSRIAQDSNPLICVDYGDGNLGLFTEYTYSKFGEYSVKFYFNNPITEIAHSAFFGSCLTSVIIPNSVTIIGNLAFASTDLQNVKFEGNSQLMHINDGAFQYAKMKKINLPPSVEYVGNCVFSGSPYLTEITGGGSKFGYMQGMYCEHNNGTSYTVIAYPAALETERLQWTGVTYAVKWGAFAYCHNIVDIELRMNRIEQYNFMGCDNLQSIELGYTTSIANDVLRDCKSLRYIDAPLASSIGENTFCNNESLTDITLGCDELATLSKVGNNNPTLNTLWIPSGVTEINESFNSAPSLVNIYCKATTPPALTLSLDAIPAEAKIYVPWTSVSAYKAAEGWHDHEEKIVGYNFETNEVVDDSELLPPSNQIWYTSTDGNIVEPFKKNVFGANIVSNTYENGKGVIEFDGDITIIGEDAFRNCVNLASLIISNSVTKVGICAFESCNNLTYVNIPASVTKIDGAAFRGCVSLKNINVPDSVISIESEAFEDCTNLESIIIPKGVTIIGYEVFRGCSSLVNVLMHENVTEIRWRALSNCSSLVNIAIPNSVVVIEHQAFSNCVSLTEVNIPEGVTDIANYTFSGCSNLAKVIIPNSVIGIGSFSFYGCRSLTEVTIPDGVMSIGITAFNACSNLQKIFCKPTNPPVCGDDIFGGIHSSAQIYVSASSVNAYKSAEYWSDYADQIVGYNF